MAKVDIHVHSKYSEHPSDWFLQRIGAKESYIDPEFVYKTAKENGMDFVTLTDHNRIDGAMLLKERHPNDVFIGLEATTYFPEDGCKIHLLVYGLNEEDYNEIELLRSNIYCLREFLLEKKLPHSVAHATYSVNKKLKLEHLEKLILLFDCFEGRNGARNKLGNEVWFDTLTSLTPEIIEQLIGKYQINPASNDPWIKTFTGGSDDHAGFFIGKTYTVIDAETPEEFLLQMLNKKSTFDGRHNDYQSLAFSIYKIAYDFSKTKRDKISGSFFSQINEMLFDKKSMGFFNKLKLGKLKFGKKKNRITEHIVELIDCLYNKKNIVIEEKLEVIYDKVASISDEYFKNILNHIEKDTKKGNLFGIINRFTSSLPGIFLSLPFMTTFQHMFADRVLLDTLENKYVKKNALKDKKILWFSDTITDLNGVSVTLKKIGWYAFNNDKDIRIVSCVSDKKFEADLPPRFINLPYFYEAEIPQYENQILRIPSILKSLKIIYDADPDEIYISSPGPLGLLGLLAGKLLNVKIINIYHTDFAMQAKDIYKDEFVVKIIDSYMKWFYSLSDTIKVPTHEYISILGKRGYEPYKMSIFGRGIDYNIFAPVPYAKETISAKYKIKHGINLLYVGRISKDKNLDFLLDLYKKIYKDYEDLNLIFTGNGPYLEELQKDAKKMDRVYFTGKVKTDNLPEIYAGSEILVFPSTTDTFGMSVLEAQSCGLPAVVSDIGGPKEIVRNGKTGFVCRANDSVEWEKVIRNMLNIISDNPKEYNLLQKEARRYVIKKYNWDGFIKSIVGRDIGKVANNDILDDNENNYLENRIVKKKIKESVTI